MVSDLLGFTLTRTIPDGMLSGILTGAYKICGGVVRNQSGQIVAHLVSSAANLSPIGGAANVVLEAVNTLQLQRIGSKLSDVQDQLTRLESATEQVVQLATGTAVLSGLTLAVSTAGFVFLNRKLNRIDEALQALTKEVKAVRTFLERQERARLVAALKTLSGIGTAGDEATRRALLINARQTLAELFENYSEQLNRVERLEEVFGIEEYFTVTALGLAMCSAELDLRAQALNDLSESHKAWEVNVRRIAKDLVFRGSAARFMDARYASVLRTDEIVDWMDYVYEANKHIVWIDELRQAGSWLRGMSSDATRQEIAEVALMRKLIARAKVYEGYKGSYALLSEKDVRPSALQSAFDSVQEEHRVNGCQIYLRDPPV